MSTLAEIEARRADRKAALAEQRDEQRATDLTALDELEASLGDNSVASIDVPFTPGLPTLAACRKPTPAEMKRYRHQTKIKKIDGEMPDMAGPAELVADSCLKYPDEATFKKMCEERPGIKVQLGLVALKLASAESAAEGKG